MLINRPRNQCVAQFTVEVVEHYLDLYAKRWRAKWKIKTLFTPIYPNSAYQLPMPVCVYMETSIFVQLY
jgi:hypothetical protein